jgi:UDP-N-acetyl-D-glucosamine dehydrogenase
MVRVSVVGQGYVGLTITEGSLLAGHDVLGFDINPLVVEGLLQGKSHIEGISESILRAGIDSGRFRPTSDVFSLESSEVVVIAVPTPLNEDGKADLSLLRAASEMIGKALRKSALIINESTSYPGTLRDVIAPIVSGFGVEHQFAVSPERVDPGNKNFGTRNTHRVVGGLTETALKEAVAFYRGFCDYVIEVSSPEVAEAAKLFENTFRFVNIGLVNEFTQILASMGIPVDETLKAAATKPYGFMPFHPNVGVGGHCIPVDPFYLEEKANEFGISSKYIQVSDQVNKLMPKFVVDRLEEEVGKSLAGLRIHVVGVTYKVNISDTRETPAESVIHLLRDRGARVTWHDPLVNEWMGEKSSANDIEADLALVLVCHDSLDMSYWSKRPVYTISTVIEHPDWVPLIVVKKKSS